MKTILLLFFALCTITWAVAVPADPPASKGETVWAFTDYLKGTRFEIRDKLNGEVVRLRNRSVELAAELKDEKRELDRDEDRLTKEGQKDPAYIAAVKEVEAAKAELDDARARHDSSSAMAASSRYNRARTAETKMEGVLRARVLSNETITQDVKNISETNRQLGAMKDPLAKAEAWRSKLREVVHNRFLPMWPLKKGDRFVPGQITVIDVAADGTITAKCDVLEFTHQTAAGESLTMVQYRPHSTTLLITGEKLADAKPKSQMKFTPSVEVVKVPETLEGIEPVVTRTNPQSDIDLLLAAVDSEEVTTKSGK